MLRRLAGLLALVLLLCGCASTAVDSGQPGHGTLTDPASGLRIVSASELPTQARTVLTEIANGGPFEYAGKDGSTFGNYEGLLPKESYGYYREYTVDTPGSSDRGTRRIIAGRDGELYYTGDHYESFERIRQ